MRKVAIIAAVFAVAFVAGAIGQFIVADQDTPATDVVKASDLPLQIPNPNVAIRSATEGRCHFGGEHAGELGYVWPDNRCHHLAPPTDSE